MPDPKQICYFCEESLDKKGRASDVTDVRGNSLGNPGVCIACDEEHNPEIKALKRQQRILQGQPVEPEKSGNPLVDDPKAKRVKKRFGGYVGPSAPITPPPPQKPSRDDTTGPNPLNG